MAQVREVFSHPVALQQCRRFFQQHPRIKAVPFYDTAGSVKHVIGEGQKGKAAIAGPQAAKQYGAKILKTGLEDNRQNFTRFVLITREPRSHAAANKTSLAFAVKNAPGSLFQALAIFARRRLNLSKIESRPVPGHPWEYVFYVDVGQGMSSLLRQALGELRGVAEFVKVLGSYRAAKPKY